MTSVVSDKTMRVRLFAAAISVLAVFAAATVAERAEASSSGGIGSGGVGDTAASSSAGPGAGGSTTGATARRYARLWDRVAVRDRRWARKTARCESGLDPDAIGGGGLYRGAFQFMRSTWKSSPRSPGGDPIRYSYRTQAVVAVALKKRDGADHWPVCGQRAAFHLTRPALGPYLPRIGGYCTKDRFESSGARGCVVG